ncbi:MAG TPA: MoxR family ATPase [Longimicrobium sp.]
MTVPEFRGSGPIPGYTPPAPRAGLAALTDPEGYEASAPLVRAVRVALALNMPLLLTGEPGTGKTQLAYRLAAELGLGEPLRFDTRSSSQANDLFFSFDTMRYFAQSQISAARDEALPEPREFVRYESLGEAIVRTWPREEVANLLPSGFPDYVPGRSLVLVDEIDKAPRDFPNDLLNQIENLEFSVPELRGAPLRVRPPDPDDPGRPELRPVVVITSNSEKQLPEPFLRRCVYHHIEFPEDRIPTIVAARLKDLPLDSPGFEGARQFFFALRDRGAGLAKKPSTSELLDWLRALRGEGLKADVPFQEQRELAGHCLGTLAKTEADVTLARKLLLR